MSWDTAVHVDMQAGGEPWIKDTEPGTSLDAIDGAEDGQQPMLEGLAARAFLGKAWSGDCAVVGRESLKSDGEVKDLFPSISRFFREGLQLVWFNGVAPSTGVWTRSLSLGV